MMTFAKGITSGYLPLGGVMLRQHVRDAMRDAPGDPPLMHVFTYSGHPVPCAVALANLDILEHEGVVDGVAAKGRRLRERLDELHDFPEVGDIRSAGLMAGVELVRDQDTREPYLLSERPTAVAAAALERGLATRALLGRHDAAGPALDRQRRRDRPSRGHSGGVHHRHALTRRRPYDARHGFELPGARVD